MLFLGFPSLCSWCCSFIYSLSGLKQTISFGILYRLELCAILETKLHYLLRVWGFFSFALIWVLALLLRNFKILWNMISTCLLTSCYLLISCLPNCEYACFSSFFTAGRWLMYLSILSPSTPSCQFHSPKSLLAMEHVGPTDGIFAANISSQIFSIPIANDKTIFIA